MSFRPSTAPPIQDMPPPGGYKKVRRGVEELIGELCAACVTGWICDALAAQSTNSRQKMCLLEFDALTHGWWTYDQLFFALIQSNLFPPYFPEFSSTLVGTSQNAVQKAGNSGQVPPPASSTDTTNLAKQIKPAYNKKCKSAKSDMPPHHSYRLRQIGNIWKGNWLI